MDNTQITAGVLKAELARVPDDVVIEAWIFQGPRLEIAGVEPLVDDKERSVRFQIILTPPCFSVAHL